MPTTKNDRVYLAIGKIAADWGALDFCLDGLVNIASQFERAPEFPRSLRRKVRFLRGAFKTLPVLSPLATEGVGLLNRIDALKRRRHTLLHGVVLETVMNDLGYRLCYSRFRGNARTVEEHPLSLSDLEDVAAQTGILLLDVAQLAVRAADQGLLALAARVTQDR